MTSSTAPVGSAESPEATDPAAPGQEESAKAPGHRRRKERKQRNARLRKVKLRKDEDRKEPREPGRRRGLLRVAGILVLAAALVAGTALTVRAGQLRDEGRTDNLALTDYDATSRVINDVSNALATVFSYTPGTLADTQERAGEWLSGPAAEEYETLMREVETLAAEQQLSMDTAVLRAGVRELTEDTARLLVFLDQVSERAGQEPTTVAAQLTVTAELIGERWRIVGITSR
ncbi:hypothetical protein RM780_13350 [Streptomyces sp. DSM 44917]|uniref:Mce-associated membrane protein n=1 Tax=Streptomyces boetiae TaxID=3075541 RepID=A0ABU2L9Q8_9ACTN|nr:hypothetical protein [Streptomyces sp. DSM 44917]MDT0307943.1 hypothetical protein [Streptomyces sp. DSM 44917]